MNTVTIGLLLSMLALILLHQHKPLPGIVLFVLGMVLMYRKKDDK